MMSFERIKTIKKRQYRYLQTSIREGTKVRSVMKYLGPASGGSAGGDRDPADDKRDRALASAERQAKKMDAYQRARFGESGEERAAREAKGNNFNQEAFLEETQTQSRVEAAPKEG